MIDQKTSNQTVKEFAHLVTRPSLRQKLQGKRKSSSIPALKNPITVKGHDHQMRGRALQAERGFKGPMLSHKEQKIHLSIRDNPFLLHTPELYSGGLYLNAVINKHPLPCGLITDFLYITVHNRAIRITLVEIEQAAHAVFGQRGMWGSSFLSGAAKGINQVRRWQAEMKHRAPRETLLLNLKSLFEHYPVELFAPDGKVKKETQIEMGYVLIVGSEPVETASQQKIIDDLYLNENILFMTYPMMIEQIEKHPVPKNMLKYGPHGISAFKLECPEIILRKGPYLGHERLPDNDPYGITTGGLGWKTEVIKRRESSHHPESLKQIFYRANAQCEHPGCREKVIKDGKVHGDFGRIYNGFKSGFVIKKLWDTNYTPLLCPNHLEASKEAFPLRLVDTGHAMKSALQARRAYRPELDADLAVFLADWRDSISFPVLRALDIDPAMEPELAGQVHQWMLAVVSLPWRWAMQLKDLVLAHYKILQWYEVSRAERMLESQAGWRCLSRAGVIKINPQTWAHLRIEPAIFNDAFINRVKAKFPGKTVDIMIAICAADNYMLNKTIEQERELSSKRLARS